MTKKGTHSRQEQAILVARAMASPPTIDRLDVLMHSDFNGNRLHFSGTDELIHIQQGQAQIVVGRKRFLLGPRDTIVLPHRTRHRDLRYGNQPCRFQYIFFHWPAGRGLLESMSAETLLKLPSGEKHHVHLLISEFEREYVSTSPAAEYRMQMLLMESLLAILRFSTPISDASDANAGAAVAEVRRKRLAEKVRAHLLENYCETVSLVDLAKRHETSTFHLSRTFSQEYGVSITDMLATIRMERAKEMLRENRLSVKEIAARTGYSASNYFSRCFKRLCGMSPSEYQLMVCRSRPAKGGNDPGTGRGHRRGPTR